MKKILPAIFGLLLTALSAHANIQELEYSVGSTNDVSAYLLLNPPLPMLYYKKGDYQVAVKPYLYSGTFQSHSEGAGNFRGEAGAASISYGLADNWGLYVLSMGNELKGYFTYTQDPGRGGGLNTKINGNKTSFAMVSPAVVYQFFGEDQKGFTLPVMLGPLAYKTSFSQEFQQSQASDGAAVNDFDMRGDKTGFGVLAGVQAGIDMGRYFRFNPYLLFAFLQEGAYETSVSNVRLNNSTTEMGDALTPSGSLSTPTNVSPRGMFAPGLNFTYRPWGLSFNIASLILKNGLGFGDYVKGASTTSYSVSWAFGNYVK